MKRAKQHCVVWILATMIAKKGMAMGKQPLFAWIRGSSKAGQGVRYSEMRNLARRGALLCGRDPREYATHSWRRGGACSYLLAGYSLQCVQLFGRWHLLTSLQVYVEPAVGHLLEGGQTRVISGKADLQLVQRAPPRPRDVNMARVRQAVAKARAV